MHHLRLLLLRAGQRQKQSSFSIVSVNGSAVLKSSDIGNMSKGVVPSTGVFEPSRCEDIELQLQLRKGGENGRGMLAGFLTSKKCGEFCLVLAIP